MKLVSFILIAACLFLSACAVGPNYRRPQASVPPQWTGPATTGIRPGVEPAEDKWWESFHDQELDSLIHRAAASNYDLKLSMGRVEEARAASGIAKSSFYPQVAAGLSV